MAFLVPNPSPFLSLSSLTAYGIKKEIIWVLFFSLGEQLLDLLEFPEY